MKYYTSETIMKVVKDLEGRGASCEVNTEGMKWVLGTLQYGFVSILAKWKSGRKWLITEIEEVAQTKCRE